MSTEVIKQSTEIYTQFSLKFRSNDDFLNFLTNHPDFWKAIKSNFNAYVAAIISVLLISVGVVITIKIHKIGSVILGNFGCTLIGAGKTGLCNSVSGIINQNF